MIKILHSADWHLDTPFRGRTDAQTAYLRQALLEIPQKIADLCRKERCDLVLLSGDLFDGPYTKESYRAVYTALEDMAVPVFISPGNHDFYTLTSPYAREIWPKNVHIFTNPAMESVTLEEPNCCVYGAGYRSMDCQGLLADFRATDTQQYQIAVLHGDPGQKDSPYCPITQSQVQRSGLHYLALGHVHKTGSFSSGGTVCAWPGCPMGRGYDELGEKGCFIVTIDHSAHASFVPLDTPRFYRLSINAGYDPQAALASVLPAVGSNDLYQIELTGESSGLDLDSLYTAFSHFPNLELRDRTVPETDLWANAGEDSLEGLLFEALKQQLHGADASQTQIITQAARICRQLLDEQEVVLP